MDNPCHPGEILKEDYVNPLELTITQLAADLGVTRKVMSEIVNKKAGISPAMSLRLSKAFDTTPEFWMNLQRNYDLWLVEKNIDTKNIPTYKFDDMSSFIN